MWRGGEVVAHQFMLRLTWRPSPPDKSIARHQESEQTITHLSGGRGADACELPSLKLQSSLGHPQGIRDQADLQRGIVTGNIVTEVELESML